MDCYDYAIGHLYATSDNSISLPNCEQLCLYIHPSVCPSVCMSVHLYVHLSECPSICMSVCLYIHSSVCLSICISICLYVHPSVCPSVCMSVYICPSVWVSIHLYVCPSVCPSVCMSRDLHAHKHTTAMHVITWMKRLIDGAVRTVSEMRDAQHPCSVWIAVGQACWGPRLGLNRIMHCVSGGTQHTVCAGVF